MVTPAEEQPETISVDAWLTGARARLEGITADSRVIIVCTDGFSSSIAAAGLHDLGLPRATDLVGGYRAWRAATA